MSRPQQPYDDQYGQQQQHDSYYQDDYSQGQQPPQGGHYDQGYDHHGQPQRQGDDGYYDEKYVLPRSLNPSQSHHLTCLVS